MVLGSSCGDVYVRGLVGSQDVCLLASRLGSLSAPCFWATGLVEPWDTRSKSTAVVPKF